MKEKVIPTTTKKRSLVRKAPAVKDMVVTFETLRGKKRLPLTTHTMDEFIGLLRDGDHREAVEELRRTLPTSRGITLSHEEIWHVPRVCPAGACKRKNGGMVITQLNGLVMLDVQNIYSADEAARIKARVIALPMTVAAFVGSSAMSVKILVRYWPADNRLPKDIEELQALHAAAYRKACQVYAATIGHEILEPQELNAFTTFRLSLDPDLEFRADAYPMQVEVPSEFSTSPLATEPAVDIAQAVEGAVSTKVPPADGSHYAYFHSRFMDARRYINVRFREEHRDPFHEQQAFLEALTARCFEMQIPVAEAVEHIAEGAPEGKQLDYTLYVKDYYAEHSEVVMPDNKMARKVRGMELLIASHYEIYRNEIDGGLYFRPRTTRGRWEALGLEKQRGMELEVLEAGLMTSTKPVQTYLQSDRIPRRNPVREFINQVKGKWDEHDRITELARCVVPDNPLWERAFHIWLLATVRQWMGIPSDHGNDVMPLLCGPQGTGKSTFCRTLLPDELRWGYLDHIDLAKRTELMRLMAQTLLINIDEFDQYRGDTQRGPLKNLLQQVDVRTRKMWRTNLEIRPRLASFIATCNPTEVLVDETGSRRFICVSVKDYIEVPKDFNYQQLYAQAVDEINMRRLNPDAYEEDDPTGRCYFTDEERESIERNNRHFRVRSVIVERFYDLFEPRPERHLRGDAASVELTRTEIAEYISRHSEKKFSREDYTQLNALLNQLADEEKMNKRRSKRGFVYHVKRRSIPII